MMDDWNLLADHFDIYKKNPNPGVISNIEDTWEALSPLVKNKKQLKILDFGCGTGALCNRLFKLGHKIVGFEPSEEMIRVAKKHSPAEIKYLSNNISEIKNEEPFDLAIAMMVFQFIPDLTQTLQDLAALLKPNGSLWLSVHNQGYVFDSQQGHTKFIEKNCDHSPKETVIVLSGKEFRTFVRSAEEYSEELKKHAFKKKQEWISDKYTDGTPGKYLVMNFAKKA